MARKPKPENPQTPPSKDEADNEIWLMLDWPKMVAAVRRASTEDQAIRNIRHHLHAALSFKKIQVESAMEKKYRRARIDASAGERVRGDGGGDGVREKFA